jgi:alpha-N-arabinofuranosidase
MSEHRASSGLSTRVRRARVRLGLLVVVLVLQALPAQAQQPVLYDWFSYTGYDAGFAQPLPPDGYRNPVLAGFHPDPSVVRVGDRFYLVNSSFAYFPGIPVFESRDLVHWKQIGNVIDRPSQLHYDGLGVSRGVFAPDIAWHDGVFYVLNTFVDGGENFLVTASNPAGPWSDPVWLPGVDGIDPSLFFDDDGTAYLIYSGEPPGGSRYNGDRAIWMQHFDTATMKPTGPRRIVLHGPIEGIDHPIWYEGPHVYRRDGWYYLSCAEGGTSVQHSQIVLRSRSPWGPYRPNPHNPILTQRDLPAGRAAPIINAGHASLVEAADGSWWSIFLASRAYDQVRFNTGRETFLLPVRWTDGWPSILPHGEVIPRIATGPAFMPRGTPQSPLSGNFTWRDDFSETTPGSAWMYLRAPTRPWVDLKTTPGWLAIQPLPEGLDSLHNPSFLARRQQHLSFDASTALRPPAQAGVDAGIAVFQGSTYWYFLGVRRVGEAWEVFLEKDGGKQPQVIARAPVAPHGELKLQVTGDRGRYAFAYDADDKGWRWLQRGDDATILSTDVAGGFVGVVLGPYARVAKPAGNH